MSGVFISHSSLDRELVEREIVTPLRKHGVEVWYSNDDIEFADDFESSIRRGLVGCEWFLIALTPSAVASSWVKSEVDWALDNRPGRVVPVLVEDCNPSELHLRLRLVEGVNLGRDREQVIKRLVEKFKPGGVPPDVLPIPDDGVSASPNVVDETPVWIGTHRPRVWKAAVLILIPVTVTVLLWFLFWATPTYTPAGNTAVNNTPATPISNQTPAGTNSNSSAANSQQGNRDASGSEFRKRPDRIKDSDLGGSNR